MVPEIKRDGYFMKDGKIHGESIVWSSAHRQKKIYGFDVNDGFKWSHSSDGYGKQCSWYSNVLRREDGHVLRFCG